MIGRKIAQYEILDKLGAGGMGEVYKARDTRLNRIAALKVLRADKLADTDRRARFVQEAQSASALNHPNIVTIYGIERDADVDFIAMEFVPGRTLDQVIGRKGMRLRDTLRIAVQIADALAAAHTAGIVHRDLKPGNIMVTDNGRVKVLDFGLAKLAESCLPSAEDATRTINAGAPITEKGTIVGTLSYMSPEQAEGRKVDARSDIFSFGSVLYEMVTGKRAFQGNTRIATISSILRDEPQPAAAIAADTIPREMERIISRCLRKEVTRRFQHMDDVKVAVQELQEESDSGRLIIGEIAPRRARRAPLMLAATGFLLMVTLAGLWALRSRQEGSKVRVGLRLRQLTQDAGLTAYPAISPDGKLIAYASDRAGDSGLDIWVQQLGRGAQPIRLTKDPADEWTPSFSPDGGQIVFSSQKEGGGVYVIPSLGGEERLLIRGQFWAPRFSPDGQWVVTTSYGGAGKAFVIPASGGNPRMISGAFYHSAYATWSPDGKKVLIWANKKYGELGEWWVVPLDGGPPVETGAIKVLQKVNTAWFNPGRVVDWDWLEWLDDYVLYTDGNLWRVRLSAETGKVSGEPERLTTGTDLEKTARAISAIPGKTGQWRIVFASMRSAESLWILPIDLNAAKPIGEPRKLITDSVARTTPSLSTDGSRLAYVAPGLENYSVRTRDMQTGSEKVLLQLQQDPRVRISPDGTTVAYNPSQFGAAISLIPSAGGESRKLCDSCGLIYDWAPDGKRVVFRTGDPIRFSAVDVSSGQQELILTHPKYDIHGLEFTRDGRWLAFHFAPSPDTPRGIYLAPVRNGKAAAENEWIVVMNRPSIYGRPFWSADGNVIYFVSTVGGKNEIWAQRLQPVTKHPIGEPFRIYSPPGERYSIRNAPEFGPAIGPHNLIFPLNEGFGNIWIAE